MKREDTASGPGRKRPLKSRRQEAGALRAGELPWRQLAEILPQMVWTCTPDGGCDFLSRQWVEYTGRPESEQLGLGWLAQVHPDDREEVQRSWEAALAAGRLFDTVFRIRRHDGAYRWFKTRALPVTGQDGRSVVKWIGSNTDIHDLREAEEALRHARDELEREVRQRTAELQQRAHQLARLASELTLAEHRERRRLAELLHDHLQQLLVGANMNVDLLRSKMIEPEHCRLLETVGEVLTEAMVLTRTLTHDLSPPVLFRGGLSAALLWLAEYMKQRQRLEVIVEASEPLDQLPEAPTVLLFGAARELLLNVAKHSGTRRAQVQLYRRGETVLLEVVDEGSGFVPAALDPGSDGQGFGLLGIRERVELLGGQLSIDSAPGRGSRVLVMVPVPAPAHPRPAASQPFRPSAPRPEGRGSTVTVVLADDHAVVRQGLVSLLEKQPGIRVVAEAANGQEAVETVQRLQPDVVLMDVSMPGMDGIEATRLIKQRWPRVRVIGLSMFEEAELAGKMREAGAEAYLAKTGPLESLLELVRPP